MDTNAQPNLKLVAHEAIPQDVFDEFLAELDAQDLSCKCSSHTGGPYGCRDWLIPAAVTLFITKSYFDGIFKEIGKDSYLKIKTATSKLYSKFFGRKPPYKFKLHSLGKKKQTKSRFSHSYSTIFETVEGFKFKLLYGFNCSLNEFHLATSLLFEYASKYESNDPNNPFSMAVNIEIEHNCLLHPDVPKSHFQTYPHTLLLFYSKEADDLLLVDPNASANTGTFVSRRLDEDWPNP